MIGNITFRTRHRITAALVILILLTSVAVYSPAYASFPATKQPSWVQPVNDWVSFGSPAFGDLDGDGKQEIVVGTNGHKVYAFHEDGSSVSGWPVSVSAPINSAPTIGDINGDGTPEVVVTVGAAFETTSPGGIYAFRANGQLLWHRGTLDINGGPNGAGDGIFASPVLADLDGDGVLDVLTASFDERVYAYHGDGSPVAGWPFLLGDGSWATPAVGDVDGDGSLDVAVVAATNTNVIAFGSAWSGALSACRKNPADPATQRGCGIVVLLSSTGKLKPGWPKFVAGQTYDSSPALADLDGDGKLEIITGNGDSGSLNDPSQPFAVTAWRANGSIMWQRATSEFVFGGAPAVGDIDGDGKPEVVVGSNDKKIYAFNHDGSTVSGFPVTLLSGQGGPSPANEPPVLADINGDGKADIVVASGWDIVAIGGSGQYLSSSLVLYTKYSLGSAPAIGDIDGDGKLEVAIGSAQNPDQHAGRVLKWDLDVGATGAALPWPQFHGNVRHTGYFATPALSTNTPQLTFLIGPNQSKSVQLSVKDVAGSALDWTASDNQPWLSVSPSNGSAPDTLTITVDSSGKGVGTYTGTVTLASSANNLTITVRMVVADTVYENFLPFTRR